MKSSDWAETSPLYVEIARLKLGLSCNQSGRTIKIYVFLNKVLSKHIEQENFHNNVVVDWSCIFCFKFFSPELITFAEAKFN